MSNNLNSILVDGNLTRDLELEDVNGTLKAVLTIASNRVFNTKEGKKEEVSYFQVHAWGVLAERCSKSLEKGSFIRAVGRLKQDRWTNSEGQAREKIFIFAEHVDFLSNRIKKQSI